MKCQYCNKELTQNDGSEKNKKSEKLDIKEVEKGKAKEETHTEIKPKERIKMELTREQQLDIYIKTAIENLKDKKESKLGVQLISWVQEREKIRFIEYCNFLLTNRLHPEYSLRDLRREVESVISEEFAE